MKLVVLGLSLSSSWGNGHATTYRALLRAFAARGHDVLFLERDVPWYAAHRDVSDPEYCRLAFYRDVASLSAWRATVAEADAVIVGSYVPDGIAVGDWALRQARGTVAFYDIDTPVTLASLERGDCAYLAERQIARYDVYLSFTGGPILDRLRDEYGAPRARALYCSVDPEQYRPGPPTPPKWDLSYLGTYSADRQPTLERLLLSAARQAPDLRFVVAGPQYPADIDWRGNVARIEHVAPVDHAAFYGASRFTLNVTRAAMIAAGHSPSVRLFEAAACGTAIISDAWPGLDSVLGGDAVAVAGSPMDVLRLLRAGNEVRAGLADRALRCVLHRHTAARRALELEAALSDVEPAATATRGRAYALS